jgi:hypothetical protein
MKADLPASIRRNGLKGIKWMLPNDQALVLAYTRDVVIVNPKECAPIGFLELPRTLAAFTYALF